jgi:hypothetical protein
LDSKITEWQKNLNLIDFKQILSELPTAITRKIEDVVKLVQLVGRYQLPGMKSTTALPVRTTFLHLLYPTVVPIFDQMVLKAVNAWRAGANQDINVMCQYIPHAWALADGHTQHLDFEESPIRLVDMALWINRNQAA